MQHASRTSPNIGLYDRLYEAAGLLWPARPGRMVVKAAEMVPPARALDIGCGDGKNAVYLANKGWNVDAFDVSSAALDGFQMRLRMETVPRLAVWQADATTCTLEKDAYELVVAYGLYHCLSDVDIAAVHARLIHTLGPGGLFAFAAFNDRLAIPAEHGTGRIYLRPENHILSLLPEWTIVAYEIGAIWESHHPVIGDHEHSLTWGLFRKPH